MMKISMPGGLFITCMVNLWLVKKGTKRNVGDMLYLSLINIYSRKAIIVCSIIYKQYKEIFFKNIDTRQ